jgi:uncharacterized damage-inducible protein DinB
MRRPLVIEYQEYYTPYVNRVQATDVHGALREGHAHLLKVLEAFDEQNTLLRYAANKWTVRELLSHLIDSERIFSYRALRFAREDQTPLPGFDENQYAQLSDANSRQWTALLRDYEAAATNSLLLFESFDEEMLDQVGVANNNQISVRALGFVIAGHKMHHADVLKQRYLPLITSQT